MTSLALFTDVSLDPQRRLGVGGYLLVPASLLESDPHAIDRDELCRRIRSRTFVETSSTKLEVQTVLWALEDAQEEINASAAGSLRIYTDSQCVAGLLQRRAVLTDRDFVAKRSGRPLANALLYGAFYEACDRLGFQVTKVAGHAPVDAHDSVQRIFSCVDRGVRKLKTIALQGHHT